MLFEALCKSFLASFVSSPMSAITEPCRCIAPRKSGTKRRLKRISFKNGIDLDEDNRDLLLKITHEIAKIEIYLYRSFNKKKQNIKIHKKGEKMEEKYRYIFPPIQYR